MFRLLDPHVVYTKEMTIMFVTKSDRIFVTGAAGFLGSHIVPALQRAFPDARLTTVGRSDYDLLDQSAAARMFVDLKPTIVVHLAAKVGGILLTAPTRPTPATKTGLAYRVGVRGRALRGRAEAGRIHGAGAATRPPPCSPIGEDQFWQGYPQAESRPLFGRQADAPAAIEFLSQAARLQLDRSRAGQHVR